MAHGGWTACSLTATAISVKCMHAQRKKINLGISMTGTDHIKPTELALGFEHFKLLSGPSPKERSVRSSKIAHVPWINASKHCIEPRIMHPYTTTVSYGKKSGTASLAWCINLTQRWPISCPLVELVHVQQAELWCHSKNSVVHVVHVCPVGMEGCTSS